MQKAAKFALAGGLGIGAAYVLWRTSQGGGLASILHGSAAKPTATGQGTAPGGGTGLAGQLGGAAISSLPSLITSIGGLFHSGGSVATTQAAPAAGSDAANTSKKITFSHIYLNLLEFFKGLMSPYMSFLLRPFLDILDSQSTPEGDNQVLWACVIEVITKSLNVDDGAYWRDDKLRQIAPSLVKQLPRCIALDRDPTRNRTLLEECLVSLTDNATDDTLLKTINLNLLMHTRSESTKLKIYALHCSTALWKSHGGKLLGFVSETATFIAECSEDENDVVVRESLKLKDAVENVAGNIDGL